MIQILATIVSLLVGGIIFLIKRNRKLESDKKLNDVKLEDSKLETEQKIIRENKKTLVEELKKLDSLPREKASDTEIETFWRNYKK